MNALPIAFYIVMKSERIVKTSVAFIDLTAVYAHSQLKGTQIIPQRYPY